MTNGMSRLVYSVVLTASVSANATGLVAWLTFGMGVVTEEEMRQALSAVPYPWPNDKQVVMRHIDDERIHEDPLTKIRRTEEIIAKHLAPIQKELEAIKRKLDAIENRMP